MENSIGAVNNEISVGEEASKFALKVGVVMAALIGVWGVACLVGGLVSVGSVSALVKSYFVALAI